MFPSVFIAHSVLNTSGGMHVNTSGQASKQARRVTRPVRFTPSFSILGICKGLNKLTLKLTPELNPLVMRTLKLGAPSLSGTRLCFGI